jgi:uncharacterized membrane protein
MKFNASEDVDAPIDMVFAAYTDFVRYENGARSRGAEVRRVNAFLLATEGAQWRGSIPIRGKTRKIEAVIIKLAQNDRAILEAVIGGMEVQFEMIFVALTPVITRVSITVNLQPRTLAARLIVQSAKLARSKIIKRIHAMLVRYADEIEAAHRRSMT